MEHCPTRLQFVFHVTDKQLLCPLSSKMDLNMPRLSYWCFLLHASGCTIKSRSMHFRPAWRGRWQPPCCPTSSAALLYREAQQPQHVIDKEHCQSSWSAALPRCDWRRHSLVKVCKLAFAQSQHWMMPADDQHILDQAADFKPEREHVFRCARISVKHWHYLLIDLCSTTSRPGRCTESDVSRGQREGENRLLAQLTKTSSGSVQQRFSKAHMWFKPPHHRMMA